MMNVVAVFAVILAGSVVFNASSQTVRLGSFRTLQHQVRGDIFAIDEKTIRIENFTYDGVGADVFLYVFRRSGGKGIVVNWNQFEVEIPTGQRIGFNGREDFTISLLFNRPNIDLQVSGLSRITVWCEPFDAFFGELNNIPATTLPPGPQMVYCIRLHNNLQVTIGYNENMTRIRLCGCIDEDQYMAFGISGSDTRTDMVGADVAVTWINDDGPNAVDYYLTDRQQCRGGVGVCPDTLLASGSGTQDISVVAGDVNNGRRCIEYSRPLSTDDRNDQSFLINGQSQFLAWAYGPRATEEGLMNLAFFHTEFPRNGASFSLDFASGTPGGNSSSCTSELSCSTRQACPGWSGVTMTHMEQTVFRVTIGLSGGLRGYQSITGLSGWGIAYYINDTMIPVLKLRRNVTYTFIVEAGNDPNDGPNYHPFYITDSIDGGILLDSPEDRMRKNEQVYAGYNMETNEPTAAGRHCEHEETAGSASVAENCNSTLQDYLDTLSLSCQGDESEAAILTWTPDENIPDVVYYQCANHVHLGWRIELMSTTINASTEVNNRTNTGMENTTDTSTENATDIGMGNTTDTGMGNTTDTGMENTTDTGIGNTTDTGMGNTTDTGMGNTTDTRMRNITIVNERNTTETSGSLVRKFYMMPWLVFAVTFLPELRLEIIAVMICLIKTRGSMSAAKKAVWRTSVLFMRTPLAPFSLL